LQKQKSIKKKGKEKHSKHVKRQKKLVLKQKNIKSDLTLIKEALKKKLQTGLVKKERSKITKQKKSKLTKDSNSDIANIKAAIMQKLQSGEAKKEQIQIEEQREPIKQIIEKTIHPKKDKKDKWIQTGITGFDDLLEKGIPKGTSTLICGGPGSGKTIFGLQTLIYGASHGEKCLYMTFEESEVRLRKHMHDFGWNPEELEKKGKLVIKRYDPFTITRQVEALLAKAKGELLIDVKPVLFPEKFKPDRIILDSLSAISAAFVGKEETYRIYIEQLFKLFEELDATSFLISESSEIPVKLTSSGVEEFLADGVILMYNIQRGNVRENAIEILKLRGAKHQKKVVAMEIISGKGVEVYPEQEVFGLGKEL